MTDRDKVPVDALEVLAYTIPTDGPDGKEADGTLEWESTTCVVVLASADGHTGLGYTYGSEATAALIDGKLASLVLGADALAPPALWQTMSEQLRDAGRPGIGMMAISAVDIALWDLRARLNQRALFRELPSFHDAVPVYGSGGFCNYPIPRLVEQLEGWVADGIPRVKLKTSRQPDEDPARLAAVRAAIGNEPELLTDANGALTRKEASYWAHRFRDEFGVSSFEEPVSSDDVTGLSMVRAAGPAGLEVAAGEYGYVLADFVRWLAADAVDCLQADVTRCGGITGVFQVAGLAAANQIDLSAHCAPALSGQVFCAVQRLRHLEYFHDHNRVEQLLFDGVLTPIDGALRPRPDVPGLGLELRRSDAEKYQVFGTAHRR